MQRGHVVAVVRAATLAGRLRADDLDHVAVLAVTHQREHDAHAARLRERREHNLVGRRSQPQRSRGSHARDVSHDVDARFLSACDGAPRLADTGHVATRRVDVQHDDLLALELRPLHLKARAEVVHRVERALDVDDVRGTGHRELGRALDERLHVSGVDGHRRRAGHRPALLLGAPHQVELLHLFDPLSPCVATPEQPRHEAGGLLPLLVVDALFPIALMAGKPSRGLARDPLLGLRLTVGDGVGAPDRLGLDAVAALARLVQRNALERGLLHGYGGRQFFLCQQRHQMPPGMTV